MINLTNAVNIKGYMMENELEWLARTARDSKCIVEIGTYYGRSARAMADNTKGRIYCIDPYPGVVFYQNGVGAISSGNYVYKQAQNPPPPPTPPPPPPTPPPPPPPPPPP